MFLIYSPDDNNVCGVRGGEFGGIESVYGLKVVKSCSWGHFIFTCSDTILLHYVSVSHIAQPAVRSTKNAPVAVPRSFLPRDAWIACRPSVRLSIRLSVTMVDQDHIGWQSWKLIARTISSTHSLFVAQKTIHLLPGEHGEILRRLEVGWEKMACWSTKATLSLKRVLIEEKLLWRAYRNSPTLFRTVPSPTPYGLVFPKIRGSQPHPKLQ